MNRRQPRSRAVAWGHRALVFGAMNVAASHAIVGCSGAQPASAASAQGRGGPPGGLDPCVAPPGTDGPESAARACYRDRVRPALSELAKRGDTSRYRFGSGEYLEHVLGLAPAVASEPMTGQAARTRFIDGAGAPVLAQVIALGSRERIDDAKRYAIVSISLADRSMPTDGGLELVFFVEPETLKTVFAIRLVHG